MNSEEKYFRMVYYSSSSTSHYTRSNTTYNISAASSHTHRRSHKNGSDYSQEQINADGYYTPAEEIKTERDICRDRTSQRQRIKTNENNNINSVNNHKYDNRNQYNIYAMKEEDLQATKCLNNNHFRKVSLHTENKFRDYAKEIEFKLQQMEPKRMWDIKCPNGNFEEHKQAEKTTYCRPVTEFYNQEILFKTLDSKRKLQCLVKKLITARAKEKQKAAWDEYINQLKKKHLTVEDYQPTTSKAVHSPNIGIDLDRLNDYYNTKFSTAPSNHCKNLVKDLYSSSMDANRYPMRSYANANIFFDNNRSAYVNVVDSQTISVDGRNINIVNADNYLTSPFINKFNPYIGLPTFSNVPSQNPYVTFPCSSGARLMKQGAQNSCDLGTPTWRKFNFNQQPKRNFRQPESRKHAIRKSINEITKSDENRTSPYRPRPRRVDRYGVRSFKTDSSNNSPNRTSDQEVSRGPKIKKYMPSRQKPYSSPIRINDQNTPNATKPKKYAQPQQISDSESEETSIKEIFNEAIPTEHKQLQEPYNLNNNKTSNKGAIPKEHKQPEKPYNLDNNKSSNKGTVLKEQKQPQDSYNLNNNKTSNKGAIPKEHKQPEKQYNLDNNKSSNKGTVLKEQKQPQESYNLNNNKTSHKGGVPKEHKKPQEPYNLNNTKTSNREAPDSDGNRTSDKERSKAPIPKEYAESKYMVPKRTDNSTDTPKEISNIDDSALKNIEQKLEVLITQMNSLLSKNDLKPVQVTATVTAVPANATTTAVPATATAVPATATAVSGTGTAVTATVTAVPANATATAVPATATAVSGTGTVVTTCCRNQGKKPVISCCKYTHISNLDNPKIGPTILENDESNAPDESKGEKSSVTILDKSATTFIGSYASVSPSKFDQIILEEMNKSDRAKRDIEGILNGDRMRPTNVQFTFDVPTRECCTEVTQSLSVAKIDEDSSVESTELELYPSCANNRLTIAVNTDPISFLALLKISTAAIGRLLSFVNFGYQSLLPLPMPRPIVGYNCSICDSSFLKSAEFREHIRAHKMQPTKDCCVCRHTLEFCRSRHPKLFKCKYCKKEFTRAYCCELHEQHCSQRQGIQHDVPESLAILT